MLLSVSGSIQAISGGIEGVEVSHGHEYSQPVSFNVATCINKKSGESFTILKNTHATVILLFDERQILGVPIS